MMDMPLNMVHKKRSYSPTIEDIRQHNIKRFRLLSDFGSLNISNTHLSHSKSSHSSQVIGSKEKDKNKEYIPDIDEFLIHNQDDDDIIQSSRLITDLQTVDPDHIVIPNRVISNTLKLSNFESQWCFERVKARKDFERKYKWSGNDDDKRKKKGGVYVSNHEILQDFVMAKQFGLVKYYNPPYLIYKTWENWYSNVFKLREFESLFDNNDNVLAANEINGQSRISEINDDLMIDDNGDDNDEDNDEDMMDID